MLGDLIDGHKKTAEAVRLAVWVNYGETKTPTSRSGRICETNSTNHMVKTAKVVPVQTLSTVCICYHLCSSVCRSVQTCAKVFKRLRRLSYLCVPTDVKKPALGGLFRWRSLCTESPAWGKYYQAVSHVVKRMRSYAV